MACEINCGQIRTVTSIFRPKLLRVMADKWEELADLIGSLNFRRKVELCTKKGLFDHLPLRPRQLRTRFEKLRKKRNEAAHETRLWKTIGEYDAIAMRERCQFAKDFLAMTTKRHHHPVG